MHYYKINDATFALKNEMSEYNISGKERAVELTEQEYMALTTCTSEKSELRSAIDEYNELKRKLSECSFDIDSEEYLKLSEQLKETIAQIKTLKAKRRKEGSNE